MSTAIDLPDASPPPPVARADLEWLLGPDAAPWLREAAASGSPPHALAAHLRRSLPAERCRLVLQQVELRRRARAKFRRADEMFFTRRSLEQASGEVVANYKATRFPAGPAADLCCGCGGDLLAIAGRGPTLGVDRDPHVVALAEANARRLLAPAAAAALQVRADDVANCALGDLTAWHIDPDRRAAGRRTTAPQFAAPPLEVLEGLLRANGSAAIKLAPAAPLPAGWPERCELEWISHGGECKQLVAWFGKLAGAPRQRRATLLGSDGPLRTLVGSAGGHAPPAPRIGRYVCEPDAAFVAADLVAPLAAAHRLSALSASSLYLTGDTPPDDVALATFEVDEVLSYRPRKLKPLLRARGIDQLEVKTRGVPLDPDAVRRQLGVTGGAAATLLLTRQEKRVVAILARRLGTS